MKETNNIRAELNQKIISAIQSIAPEIEESTLDLDADLREECDIDSMDFLNFLTALKHSTGISIPENDYDKVSTLTDLLNYLETHMT